MEFRQEAVLDEMCIRDRLRSGKTVSEYIIEIRLGHAARLLVDTTNSIAEICYDCGFNNCLLYTSSPVVSLVSHYHKGSREALLGNDVSEELAHQFSIERKVSRDTPPCFLVHANNDQSVDPLNSIMYYISLKEMGVDVSLHIFPKGGHQIALRNNPGSANLWTVLCLSLIHI